MKFEFDFYFFEMMLTAYCLIALSVQSGCVVIVLWQTVVES